MNDPTTDNIVISLMPEMSYSNIFHYQFVDCHRFYGEKSEEICVMIFRSARLMVLGLLFGLINR